MMSVHTSVQMPAPAGERWIVTDETPEPVSLAVAFSEIVARSGEPGSVIVTVGSVLSTRRFVTVEVFVRAALSVAIARKS